MLLSDNRYASVKIIKKQQTKYGFCDLKTSKLLQNIYLLFKYLVCMIYKRSLPANNIFKKPYFQTVVNACIFVFVYLLITFFNKISI